MAKKKVIKVRSGLGRGLDSLIPAIDEEESKSLEELLNSNKKEDTGNTKIESIEESIEDKSVEEISSELEAEESKEPKPEKSEELEKEKKENQELKEEVVYEDSKTDISNKKETATNEETASQINTTTELILSESELKSKEEVIGVIAENPRITLWSARSAAVLRYLRKTKPEFSISKESSTLIDEAIKEKYPKIWGLFEDL